MDGKGKAVIPKMRKVNLSVQLLDAITELVENGSWKPGDKLPNEIELAASFNVSRNIMREAMKILNNFGVLESKAGIGTFVTEGAQANIHSMRFFEKLKRNTSVEKILETRLVIEPDLAYYACLRATNEEIEELDALVKAAEKTWKTRNYFYTEDFGFHMRLAQMSRNDILSNLISTMLDQLKSGEYIQFNQYTKPEERNIRFDDHRRIVEALKKRDALLAQTIMYDHLFGRIRVINPTYGTDLAMCKKIEKKRQKQGS
ncbi:FadR/GntR family transcriptional regulator [Oscillibacter valericigenes]|uniref:FadR/GntR family transcriptional regulator n=1 Tax=Oscillibacter valericigenes TaxID=351091 RepID=UPI001959A04A|nr:FadR/GntR family transcriptional regulator [Oscillibacter valericigenes]MBM6910878.1 FadR family transcriptional regulator [Oscillibacter valericigenes]